MKHESNSKAVLFLALVWTVFLLILANEIFKEAIQLTSPRAFKIINLEDLMNGNP